MSAVKDVVIVAAGAAYDLYVKYAMYFSQPGRSFQPVERIGFYTGNEIKPYFPRILARRDHVGIDRSSAHTLRLSSSNDEAAIGQLVERLLDDGVLGEGDVQQVFLLSPTGDPRTLVLPGPIHNVSVSAQGRRVAWTQGQRYVSSAALEAAPETTADLIRVTNTSQEVEIPASPDLRPAHPLEAALFNGHGQEHILLQPAGHVVPGKPDSPQLHHQDQAGMTSLSVTAEHGLEGQTPWYQEIREIHDQHFHDPWQERADAINRRHALSRAHKLFTPAPGVPMPWFNGDIEAVEPGRWVLVISLNHYVNPAAREALDRDTAAQFTPETYWDHWRTFNMDHWYRDFFGPLARVAATALGDELTREEEPAFATNRMIFVEICPYGSQQFSLSWQDVEELLATDVGFQRAADVNRLLIEQGRPALVMVNGLASINMIEHLYPDALRWREIRYDSCDLPVEGCKPKRLRHYCGSLTLSHHAVPVVGFPFLCKPGTHNSKSEQAQLANQVFHCVADQC